MPDHQPTTYDDALAVHMFGSTPTCDGCGADLSVIRIAACCDKTLPGPTIPERFRADTDARGNWL